MTSVAEFIQVWWLGLSQARACFDKLATKPAPHWGLAAVLARFVITTLTTTLALLLLGRTPFQPSYLTFLPDKNYYRVLVWVFPVFGLAAWLLMSGVAYVLIRLGRRQCNYDQMLNIVGMSMLIPMPLSDWTYWGDVRLKAEGTKATVLGKVAWLSTTGVLIQTSTFDEALPLHLKQMQKMLDDDTLDPDTKLMEATHFGMRRLRERGLGHGHCWPFVFSAVLVKSGGTWRFHTIHWSMPVD